SAGNSSGRSLTARPRRLRSRYSIGETLDDLVYSLACGGFGRFGEWVAERPVPPVDRTVMVAAVGCLSSSSGIGGCVDKPLSALVPPSLLIQPLSGFVVLGRLVDGADTDPVRSLVENVEYPSG